MGVLRYRTGRMGMKRKRRDRWILRKRMRNGPSGNGGYRNHAYPRDELFAYQWWWNRKVCNLFLVGFGPATDGDCFIGLTDGCLLLSRLSLTATFDGYEDRSLEAGAGAGQEDVHQPHRSLVVDLALRTGDYIPFFETTIRYLGGCLSAYAFSGEKPLLTLVDNIGMLLLPAFKTMSDLAGNMMAVPFLQAGDRQALVSVAPHRPTYLHDYCSDKVHQGFPNAPVPPIALPFALGQRQRFLSPPPPWPRSRSSAGIIPHMPWPSAPAPRSNGSLGRREEGDHATVEGSDIPWGVYGTL
ncbi:hypothetical protein BKA70DRAFT_1235273 [Coprinopsis sp. MPI-PUGE-AT-0042]|nr:hypothetical protein BKA70DRAFT_1235273 [Coprinopsis sp. MPI-PUGE-AT-0042]